MARRGRPKGGRTTPKASGGRYTPPIPREQKVSPLWVPVTMFTCLGLGALVIVTNYFGILPGGTASNGYLILGLVLITTGFIVATRYH